MQTVFFVVTAYSGDLLLEKTGALFDSNRHLWYFFSCQAILGLFGRKRNTKTTTGKGISATSIS